jgi:hypothetical protein
MGYPPPGVRGARPRTKKGATDLSSADAFDSEVLALVDKVCHFPGPCTSLDTVARSAGLRNTSDHRQGGPV